MSAGSIPSKAMVSTPISDMVSTSTSSTESDSTAPELEVFRTPSGRTLPVELRHVIYRLLFKDSVVGLIWGNCFRPTWGRDRIKIIHARNSGYGIFFASKASQEDSAAHFYSAVTWQMTNIYPDTLRCFPMNSFDRNRFQRLSWRESTHPEYSSTWMPMDLKLMSLATSISNPLVLVLPPHHMDETALLAKFERALRRSWYGYAQTIIQPREFALKCTIWCVYPPYTFENGEIKVNHQRDLRWLSRWVLDVDSKKVVRHPDNFVLEWQSVPEDIGRVLDADGENELGMEVYGNYMRKVRGVEYSTYLQPWTHRGPLSAHLDDTTDDEDDDEDEETDESDTSMDSEDWHFYNDQPVDDWYESNVEWTRQYNEE